MKRERTLVVQARELAAPQSRDLGLPQNTVGIYGGMFGRLE